MCSNIGNTRNFRIVEDFLMPALHNKIYTVYLEWVNEAELRFRIWWPRISSRININSCAFSVFKDWDAAKGRVPPRNMTELVISRQRFKAALRRLKIERVRGFPPYREYSLKKYHEELKPKMELAISGNKQIHKFPSRFQDKMKIIKEEKGMQTEPLSCRDLLEETHDVKMEMKRNTEKVLSMPQNTRVDETSSNFYKSVNKVNKLNHIPIRPLPIKEPYLRENHLERLDQDQKSDPLYILGETLCSGQRLVYFTCGTFCPSVIVRNDINSKSVQEPSSSKDFRTGP